jgi:predicted GIY-YIG superfamily endonuclease
MIYWLYILYSESLDKYYVGSTRDLEGRIRTGYIFLLSG